MAIGGFNGTDNSPTLAQFKAYVAAGKIHYFIASGGGMGGPSAGRQQQLVECDHSLGRGELHRADDRRYDGLRPDRGTVDLIT